MAGIGHTSNNLENEIKDIKRRLYAMETSARVPSISNTAVEGGGLQFFDEPDFDLILAVAHNAGWVDPSGGIYDSPSVTINVRSGRVLVMYGANGRVFTGTATSSYYALRVGYEVTWEGGSIAAPAGPPALFQADAQSRIFESSQSRVHMHTDLPEGEVTFKMKFSAYGFNSSGSAEMQNPFIFAMPL